MNDLQVFNFENNEVRTVMIDETPYFVGKDVAEALGYQNGSRDVNRHVDEDDRQNYQDGTFESNRGMTVINESGVYSLVFGSKLPQAKKFKHWVTSEVLPSIRKTGGYQVTNDPMQALKLMFDATSQTNEKVAKIDYRVKELEENAPLDPGEYNMLNKKVSQRIRTIKRERGMELTKQQNSELYKSINREIKAITGVHTRSQLRRRHLDGVLEFILDWEPSKATIVVINQLSADI